MEKELIDQWEKNKAALKQSFEAEGPSSYDDIFKRLFEVVFTDDKWQTDKITTIDDGHYQGTRIFIIPKDCYQPSETDYLVCSVGYGSCSGCDTYEAIASEQWDDEKPLTESQLSQYMSLALHMVQGTKPLFSDERQPA